MNTLQLAGEYIFNFVSSQEFQRRQPWVLRIGEICRSIMHQDAWTGIRLFALSFLTCAPDIYTLNLLFLFFALTDWIDGIVAWLNGANGWWGAFWDGLVDKVYSQSLLWYFGYNTINFWALLSMTIIEFGSYSILFCIRVHRIFKQDESWVRKLAEGNIGEAEKIFFSRWIEVFKGKNNENVYAHLMVGKYKFALQNILAFLLINTGNQLLAVWRMFLNLLVIFINILAFLSAAWKIRPNFLRFPKKG